MIIAVWFKSKVFFFLFYNYKWVWLMYAIRAYINKFVFEKFLSKIEKIVKNFSNFDNFSFQYGILLCALRSHINKIHHKFIIMLNESRSSNCINLCVHVHVHVSLYPNILMGPGPPTAQCETKFGSCSIFWPCICIIADLFSS